MLIDLITFLIATVIITGILYFLPLNINKKMVVQIAIISSMLALLTYTLFTLYSLAISGLTLLVLLVVFSYVIGKMSFVNIQLDVYEELESHVDDIESSVSEVVEDPRPSSRRMEQETIDQLLKDALQDNVETITDSRHDTLSEEKERFEEEPIVGTEVNSTTEEIEVEKESIETTNIESTEFEELEDIEEIIQNRPRTSLLSYENTEGESLLSYADVNQDEEETSMLGRQFADMEENELPPRPSAFDEESVSHNIEVDDTSIPLLGRQLMDSDEEGLPPRPSAFENEEHGVDSGSTVHEEEDLFFMDRELIGEEDQKDHIFQSTIDDIASTHEPEELKDELELNVRSYLEVEKELLERKTIDEQNNLVKEKVEDEDSNDGIMKKRSEMFDRLEDSLFDDKK